MKRDKVLRTPWAMLAGLAVSIGTLVPFARAEEPVTDRELAAYLPYDLGPDTIDVSSYPAVQQINYELFHRKCSLCHTLARPINAPMTSREEWDRFIGRMDARMHTGVLLSTEERRRVLDFLEYDSRIRKLDNRQAFNRLQVHLKARFEAVQKEKQRRSENAPTKEAAPYTGSP